MTYWLTTHWPPRRSEDEALRIYLAEGREGPGARIAVGDLVFVYEAASGRTLVEHLPSGATRPVPCRRGRAGIILLGRVTATLALDKTTHPEQYVDGTTTWWRWRAPLEVVSRRGFVPRPDVARALGYRLTYNFHGFGEQHSGLLQLSEARFAKLEGLFHSSRPRQPRRDPLPRGSKNEF